MPQDETVVTGDAGGTVRYHRAEYDPGELYPWLVCFSEGGDCRRFTAAAGEAMGLVPPDPPAPPFDPDDTALPGTVVESPAGYRNTLGADGAWCGPSTMPNGKLDPDFAPYTVVVAPKPSGRLTIDGPTDDRYIQELRDPDAVDVDPRERAPFATWHPALIAAINEATAGYMPGSGMAVSTALWVVERWLLERVAAFEPPPALSVRDHLHAIGYDDERITRWADRMDWSSTLRNACRRAEQEAGRWPTT